MERFELLFLILGIILLLIWAGIEFYHQTHSSQSHNHDSEDEQFNIPIGSSSAWGWNTGPGYGAGYGTGYGRYGVWPSSIPTRPWKNWMWGRRPSIFTSYETPAPQIDYGYERM